ncbi:hypothetical protein [Nonomuraea zeae]|uniref:Thioredoxin family protein n=1 Tax=Nonomuraea zeae TaxID=1642303 RepID=A0A5S4GXN7_9ACTN|nr:hypothetical protein [Nonomuraea zeae]TMR37214.1 hypothetical protein ETD85_08805 [Nonomuraea zeae]
MGIEAAAILLSWIAIVILAGAVAACVRALRFQEARLLQVLSQPRRLSPGDRMMLPRPLAGHLPPGDSILLLFGTAECGSCREALRNLAARYDAGRKLPHLVAAFRGPAPDVPGPPVTVVTHQAQAFEELNIGLLPFAVLLRDDEVVAAGAVGSEQSIDELWRTVERTSDREASAHG